MQQSDITQAIEEMADELKKAESVNQKHCENIKTMVNKINQLNVEVIALQEERETWVGVAESRERELDLYINRKVVGQEMINDYFGKIFEKTLDEFLGHLHHSKKSQAEQLLSLTEKQRKEITSKRINFDNEIGALLQSYEQEVST